MHLPFPAFIPPIELAVTAARQVKSTRMKMHDLRPTADVPIGTRRTEVMSQGDRVILHIRVILHVQDYTITLIHQSTQAYARASNFVHVSERARWSTTNQPPGRLHHRRLPGASNSRETRKCKSTDTRRRARDRADFMSET